MAGVRHHILPRFLLKGFISRADNNSQFSWLYRKNSKPVEVSTKDINIEKHFYGREGEPYPDPEITDIEREFAPFIDSLRLISTNTKISDEKIIHFISHILIRTKNARDSLYETTEYWTEEISNFFSDINRIKEPLLKLISKHLLDSMYKNYPETSEQEIVKLHRVLVDEMRNSMQTNSKSLIEGQRELLEKTKLELPQLIKQKHNELIKKELIPADMVKNYQNLNWFACKTNENLIISVGVTQLSESHCNYDAKVVFQLSRKACVYKA